MRLPSAGGGGTAAATTVDGIVSSAQDPLIARLENHPAILEATPNTVQSPFQIASSKYPLPRIGMNAGAGETVDWGMVDAKLDQLWPRVTSPGLAVGIIDVGFDDHEDILMQKGLQQDLTVDDHGNHVAGIACAKHDNLLGIRGAAPRCTARVAVGSFLFPVIDPIESDGPLGFHTLFSELVSTVLDFINQNNDVAVINLSLGYNWMPNFGINPEDNGMEAVRDLVRGQGRVMLSILEYARRNDVIIVSAAGNDSSELGANPLGAQWASPFNWAALAMKEMRGWSNGIVVEAHDRAGQRAAFSNDEGSVSAPGVRIFSALAGAPNRYGEMSGTSMASPLVSGGVALLRDVRPDLTLEQVYQCILSGPVTSSSSTPKVDFLQAADQC